MQVIPEPSPDDVPFNDPYTVTLSDGQKATVRYEPEQSGATFVLAALGISKQPGSIYEARADGGQLYEAAQIPPTDIDDMTATWVPAKTFSDYLEVIIRNNSGSAQTYHIQPIGYEQAAGDT